MEKQTGIWRKFKEDMKQNNAKFAVSQNKNISQMKVRQSEIIEEGKTKRASIEGPIKEDMKEKKAKFAADHQKNISQAKAQLKEINAEGKEKRDAIERPKADFSKVGSNKWWMILWVTLLASPLLLIAGILFVMGVLLFWDAIFGL